jgi:ubiquinone/menaquinone biosynthesis C-methylase UbiE
MTLNAGNQAEFYNQTVQLYNKKYHSIYVEKTNIFELTNGLICMDRNELGEIIDIGCGTGKNYEFIKEKCSAYIGVDVSQKQIEQANLTYGQENNVSFFVGDAQNLNFKPGSFDTVIIFGCLHHLQNPKKALKEAFRLLRKGGTILLYEPSKHNLVLRFLRYLFKKFHPAFHPDEVSFYRNELVALVDEAGFNNTKIIYQIYLTGFFSLYNLKTNPILDKLFDLFFRIDTFLTFRSLPEWIKKQSFSLTVIASK